MGGLIRRVRLRRQVPSPSAERELKLLPKKRCARLGPCLHRDTNLAFLHPSAERASSTESTRR